MDHHLAELNLNIEYRTRNFECRSMDSLRSIFLMVKNDRIPYFDIRQSIFYIRYSKSLLDGKDKNSDFKNY